MRIIFVLLIGCFGVFSVADAKDVEVEVMDQARDLESVLISVMVEPMFPEGDKTDLYGGGHGSSIYRTMMIQEYGKILSDGGGLGVAEGIAKGLTK